MLSCRLNLILQIEDVITVGAMLYIFLSNVSRSITSPRIYLANLYKMLERQNSKLLYTPIRFDLSWRIRHFLREIKNRARHPSRMLHEYSWLEVLMMLSEFWVPEISLIYCRIICQTINFKNYKSAQFNFFLFYEWVTHLFLFI